MRNATANAILSEFQFLSCSGEPHWPGRFIEVELRPVSGIDNRSSSRERKLDLKTLVKIVSKWGRAETWFWIHGPDEELGCSFFSRPRSRGSYMYRAAHGRSSGNEVENRRRTRPRAPSPACGTKARTVRSQTRRIVRFWYVDLMGCGWLSRIASSQIS